MHAHAVRIARWIQSQGIPMDGKTRAQVYAWHLPTGETRYYSIDAAEYAIEKLELPSHPAVSPDDARALLERNQFHPDPDSPAVAVADLSRPVIIATMETPDGTHAHTLIDGWHRITKAVKTGHTQMLRAFILPKEVTELCCIGSTFNLPEHTSA